MRGGNQGGVWGSAAPYVSLAALFLLGGFSGDASAGANEKSILVTDSHSEFGELVEMPLEPTLAEPAMASDLEPIAEPRLAQATGVFSFHGVVAGSTNRQELLREWGDPQEADSTARVLSYQFERIPVVRVTLDGDLVESLLIKLQSPLPAEELIEKLELQEIRPALLADDAGRPLAQVFPEQGVLFRLQAVGPATAQEDASVVAVVIQTARAAAFLLRAENNLGRSLTDNIADVQEALRLDHRSAYAHWLLSRFYLEAGRAVDAERLAAESVEFDPISDVYRLQWAKCLRQMARYDLAVTHVRTVLESPNLAPIVRAQGLHEMGLLAGIGAKETARRAAALHNKAIEIADGLASSEDRTVRLAAKQLLVDAHLAMAQQIAQGQWSQQDQIMPQWIERASALSENLIAEDRRHLPLRLRVAVTALAATASMTPPIDPQLWILEAEQTASELSESTDDPLVLSQIDWKLGLVYFHSAQIEYHRGNPAEALRLGAQADEKLAELAFDRGELPDTSYVLGDLYFQMGAVHAVHYEDHEAACEWYGQAAEKLLQPVPVTTLAAPGRHGDALVSMGVSYWHTGRQQRGIELTQAGVDLIEQAVESGILEADTLSVPYANLAAMYEANGDDVPADRYTRLASRLGSDAPATPDQR